MTVAILIPTLGRADVLAPLVESFRVTTPPDFYRLYFVVDRDDAATHQSLAEFEGDPDVQVDVCDGTYPVKIYAGCWLSAGEDLVLPTADDIVPHLGWYEAALKHFEAGADVVGTNDLSPATREGRMVTMPIVRRSYTEDPGAAWDEHRSVFHRGYHHNFVDRELWELACHRGVAVFEPESVIEHRHHGWGTREADETDAKGNQQGWEQDKALFEKRKAQWLAS